MTTIQALTYFTSLHYLSLLRTTAFSLKHVLLTPVMLGSLFLDLLPWIILSFLFSALWSCLSAILRCYTLHFSISTLSRKTPLLSWPQIPKICWWFTLLISGTLELNIQDSLLDIFPYHYSFPASGTPSNLLFLLCFLFQDCLRHIVTDNLYASFGLMW